MVLNSDNSTTLVMKISYRMLFWWYFIKHFNLL